MKSKKRKMRGLNGLKLISWWVNLIRSLAIWTNSIGSLATWTKLIKSLATKKNLIRFLVMFIIFGSIGNVLLTNYWVSHHNLGTVNIIQLSKFMYEIVLIIIATQSLFFITFGFTIDLFYRETIILLALRASRKALRLRIRMAFEAKLPAMIRSLTEEFVAQNALAAKKTAELVALQEYKYSPLAYNARLNAFFDQQFAPEPREDIPLVYLPIKKPRPFIGLIEWLKWMGGESNPISLQFPVLLRSQ